MRSVDEWITSDQGVGCVGMMGERDVERGVIWRVRASFSCKNKPWNREGKSVVKRGSEMRVSLNYRGLDGRIHKRGQKKSEQRMGCCEGKRKCTVGPRKRAAQARCVINQRGQCYKRGAGRVKCELGGQWSRKRRLKTNVWQQTGRLTKQQEWDSGPKRSGGDGVSLGGWQIYKR